MVDLTAVEGSIASVALDAGRVHQKGGQVSGSAVHLERKRTKGLPFDGGAESRIGCIHRWQGVRNIDRLSCPRAQLGIHTERLQSIENDIEE